MRSMKVTPFRTRPKIRLTRTQSTLFCASSNTILNQSSSLLSSSSSSSSSSPSTFSSSSISLFPLSRKKKSIRKKRTSTSLSSLLHCQASLKKTRVLIELIHKKTLTLRSFLSFSKDCLKELSHIEQQQQLQPQN